MRPGIAPVRPSAPGGPPPRWRRKATIRATRSGARSPTASSACDSRTWSTAAAACGSQVAGYGWGWNWKKKRASRGFKRGGVAGGRTAPAGLVNLSRNPPRRSARSVKYRGRRPHPRLAPETRAPHGVAAGHRARPQPIIRLKSGGHNLDGEKVFW
jgi:hypothetical protein